MEPQTTCSRLAVRETGQLWEGEADSTCERVWRRDQRGHLRGDAHVRLGGHHGPCVQSLHLGRNLAPFKCSLAH